jgi:NAD(P)-dependent dehydrogenase (short-subunit alcohol dehydrogenase family)
MTVEIDLSGKTAIVTGASRGIGRLIADRFGGAGANIVAAARSDEEIEDTVDMVERHGANATAVSTDLRNIDDINQLVDKTVEEYGVPNILVNNAGVNITNCPLDHTPNEIGTMIDVNLRGLFILSQCFGRELRESCVERGRIINISSVAAQLGIPQMAVYGATKSGVNGITRGLAAELASDGITVNSVSPGLIAVDRIEELVAEKGDDIYDLDRIPLGRIGKPVDVANVCLFLASDLGEYVTGEDIRVDGGVTFTGGLYK